MAEQGGDLVKHYRDISFMGFLEVILNLRKISANLSFCRKDLLKFSPDVLILVDYPGFNLRIARFAHQKGIRVFYYISPQLWAWRSSRVKIIKEAVERMFVILPFEQEFYRKFNYHVDFSGHPLLDVLTDQKRFMDSVTFRKQTGLDETLPIIALLPGSRKQEISKILPIMLDALSGFQGYQFVTAAAPAIPLSFYKEIAGNSTVKIISGPTYELLHNSEAALVTSGTATLETALLDVPQVVCYKGSTISYLLARLIVRVPYISLVNLVMGKEIVRELIQSDLSGTKLSSELKRLLSDKNYREVMKAGYQQLREKLGGQGASAKTAKLMIQYLKKN